MRSRLIISILGFSLSAVMLSGCEPSPWVARYNGPVSDSDFANDVGISPDATVLFVTGDSYGGSTTVDDYATVGYDTH